MKISNSIIIIITLLLNSCSAQDQQTSYLNTINYAVQKESKNAVILEHEGFTISYIPAYYEAEWVAYTLTKDKIDKRIQRIDNYDIDPFFKNCANREDYRNSGYDRGHLFPAADSWTDNIMKESFYYTNICPQDNGFNSGVWNRIETLVRNWAIEYDTISVVTGSVFKDITKKIGRGIVVPEYLYKVIVVNTSHRKQAIAFYVKNEASQITDSRCFTMSIDELENILGIDFCINLPENIEIQIERDKQIDKWLFNKKNK